MLTVDANVWIAAADNTDVFFDESRRFLIDIALYVTIAEQYDAQLVSWDNELIERAAAMTPNGWLTTNA